jgi:predicted RND superfamily exporter protein
MSSSETAKAIVILVPVILFILIISTTSWLEPLLYLAAIGVAVLINIGHQCFFWPGFLCDQGCKPHIAAGSLS